MVTETLEEVRKSPAFPRRRLETLPSPWEGQLLRLPLAAILRTCHGQGTAALWGWPTPARPCPVGGLGCSGVMSAKLRQTWWPFFFFFLVINIIFFGEALGMQQNWKEDRDFPYTHALHMPSLPTILPHQKYMCHNGGAFRDRAASPGDHSLCQGHWVLCVVWVWADALLHSPSLTQARRPALGYSPAALSVIHSPVASP